MRANALREKLQQGGPGVLGVLAIEDVQAGHGNFIFLKRRQQGCLIDQSTTGSIDQNSTVFHPAEFFGIHQMMRFRSQRTMDRNDIGLG